MKTYQTMTRAALLREKEALEQQYKEAKALNLNLNMSRGKPSSEQLNLSAPMMNIFNGYSILFLDKK